MNEAIAYMREADRLPRRETDVLVLCHACKAVARAAVGTVHIQPPRFGVVVRCRCQWLRAAKGYWYDLRDENVTWCRETEGEAADAFRAVAALS